MHNNDQATEDKKPVRLETLNKGPLLKEAKRLEHEVEVWQQAAERKDTVIDRLSEDEMAIRMGHQREMNDLKAAHQREIEMVIKNTEIEVLRDMVLNIFKVAMNNGRGIGDLAAMGGLMSLLGSDPDGTPGI